MTRPSIRARVPACSFCPPSMRNLAVAFVSLRVDDDRTLAIDSLPSKDGHHVFAVACAKCAESFPIPFYFRDRAARDEDEPKGEQGAQSALDGGSPSESEAGS